MCIAAPHCRTHSTQLRTPCASPSTFGAPPHQLQTRSAYITISGPISTPNILGGYSAPFGYLVLGCFAPNKLLKCHWIFSALFRCSPSYISSHCSCLGLQFLTVDPRPLCLPVLTHGRQPAPLRVQRWLITV